MEHGLYLKLEKIVDKLANEKGCMVKDPEKYPNNKNFLASQEIQYGKDKGKLEYYDMDVLFGYHDFLVKCFGILPRDNLSQISHEQIPQTGVTMDTLLSDKSCSPEERDRQKSVIMRFFTMARSTTPHIGLRRKYVDSKTGEKKYVFELNEPIPTTYKKSSSTKKQEIEK